MLDLDVSEAVESLLASLVEESEGVEESERGLDTELRLELLCNVPFICRLFIDVRFRDHRAIRGVHAFVIRRRYEVSGGLGLLIIGSSDDLRR